MRLWCVVLMRWIVLLCLLIALALIFLWRASRVSVLLWCVTLMCVFSLCSSRNRSGSDRLLSRLGRRWCKWLLCCSWCLSWRFRNWYGLSLNWSWNLCYCCCCSWLRVSCCCCWLCWRVRCAWCACRVRRSLVTCWKLCVVVRKVGRNLVL